MYLHSSDNNYDLAALIKNAKINILRLNSNMYFNFNTIPEKIFSFIKEKLHLITELEIELFKNFPIEILSEYKMLRKLGIILKVRKFLGFLKELIYFEIFEKLDDLYITVTDNIEIIKIATIIKHFVFADSVKYICKSKLPKDLEEIKDDEFEYFYLMITRNAIKLNLYSLIIRELI